MISLIVVKGLPPVMEVMIVVGVSTALRWGGVYVAGIVMFAFGRQPTGRRMGIGKETLKGWSESVSLHKLKAELQNAKLTIMTGLPVEPSMPQDVLVKSPNTSQISLQSLGPGGSF